MRISFVAEAKREFLEIISYYQTQEAEVGRRFKVEVEQSSLWLSTHAEACQLRPRGYRRFNLRIFPYYIPYIVRGSTLWVLAIAHVRRKPEYWIQRKTAMMSL
jgi:plasmid stabilization system protein ParE